MGLKLYDELRSGKPNVSYDDVHHEVMGSVNDGCSLLSGLHQKPKIGRNVEKGDELVKHMSNIPDYLERGQNTREMVLNVGVLEWGRLEKWQYSQKQISRKDSSSSSSIANTSAFFPADRSQTPARQRRRHPSLQSHLLASPIEGRLPVVRSIGKTQYHEADQRNSLNGQMNFGRTDKVLHQSVPNIKPAKCNSNSKTGLECRTLPNGLGEFGKRVGCVQEPKSDLVNQGTSRRNKNIDHLNNHPGKAQISEFKMLLGLRSKNAFQRSFSETPEGAFCQYAHPSCPLQYEADSDSQAKGSSSEDADHGKSTIHSTSGSAKAEVSASNTRDVVQRKTSRAISLTIKDSSCELDQKVSKSTNEKGRSTLPFCRFSLSIGNKSRSSVVKDYLDMPKPTPAPNAYSKSSEHKEPNASLDVSNNEKSVVAVRGRSSPLRRLLDPLLKPKVSSSTVQIDNSTKDKRHASSSVQALLKIAVKNGLPLLTFAVENSNDVIAATFQKLYAFSKEDCSFAYTFFTFREVRKRNGSWINQGGKDKYHNFISNVVAQLKISDSHISGSTGQNCLQSSTVKEFVLFSVKPKEVDDQASDYQPNEELAAVIVKIPSKINSIGTGHQTNCYSLGQDRIRTTVVLPSGVHTHPTKGGPSSLVERWKSGGSCDCGGWDLGCKLKILADRNQVCKTSNSSVLFLQGGGLENQPAFSFSALKHGIYSVTFDHALSHLQAFSICIALLETQNPILLSESNNLIGGKNSRETSPFQTDGTMAFSKSGGDIPASCVAYLPPLSPVGRV